MSLPTLRTIAAASIVGGLTNVALEYVAYPGLKKTQHLILGDTSDMLSRTDMYLDYLNPMGSGYVDTYIRGSLIGIGIAVFGTVTGVAAIVPGATIVPVLNLVPGL